MVVKVTKISHTCHLYLMFWKGMEDSMVPNYIHEEHQSAYRKFQDFLMYRIIIDQNNVMLDLPAAFDFTDHNTLLQRLEHFFDIKSKPLQWISFYPSNRFLIVCIDGELCSWSSVFHKNLLCPMYYTYTMYIKPVGYICNNHGLDHHF